ncbi:GcrA family cell cycle regulator [Rhizobium mongolense]
MNVHTKVTSRHTTEWDAETKQIMADLWNDGQSASQIAARFGASRSAIIGLAHRNRDMFKGKKKRTGGRPVKKAHSGPVTRENDGRRLVMQNIHKARMEAARREAEEFEAGTSPLLQIHVSDEERLATGKELHDLERDQCRWPLNNGSPFLFCADATGGALYCWHHMNRAYRVREG